MKKRAGIFLIALAVLFLFSACAVFTGEDAPGEEGIPSDAAGTGLGELPWALVNIKPNAEDPSSNADTQGDPEKSSVSGYPKDPVIVSFSENSSPVAEDFSDASFDQSKYCYHKLNDHEKIVYSQIYHIINERITEEVLVTMNEDEVDRCFNCVMTDNPEFFYTDGYGMTRTDLNGKPQSLSFAPRYTMNEETILSMEDSIDSYVNQFLASMPPCPDEYSKAKYLFDYLTDNTEYDVNSPNSQNICSVFKERRSVCQGYAMAAKYLCDELGIFCTVVYGQAGGESHAWDIMRLDGTYCHVDVTWGDSSYHNSSEGTNEAMKDYVFMGASDDVIRSNHTISHIVPPPVCMSLASYYFVREGKYFTSLDIEKLDEAFDRAYSEQSRILTIRCSDDNVYSEFDDYLFSKGNIFEFVKDGTRARYVRNREELTISFIL